MWVSRIRDAVPRLPNRDPSRRFPGTSSVYGVEILSSAFRAENSRGDPDLSTDLDRVPQRTSSLLRTEMRPQGRDREAEEPGGVGQ